MRKLLLLTVAVFGFGLVAQAQQISENAIGLRLGDMRWPWCRNFVSKSYWR